MISHRNWIKRNGKRKANNINSWSNWRDNHILSKFSPWNWYHWWNTNGIVCIPIFVFFLLLFSNTRQEIRRHYWQRSNCVILKLKNMSSRIPNYKSNKNIFSVVFLFCLWIWIEIQFVSANKCCFGHVSSNFNWIFLTFTCTFESFQFVCALLKIVLMIMNITIKQFRIFNN